MMKENGTGDNYTDLAGFGLGSGDGYGNTAIREGDGYGLGYGNHRGNGINITQYGDGDEVGYANGGGNGYGSENPHCTCLTINDDPLFLICQQAMLS